MEKTQFLDAKKLRMLDVFLRKKPSLALIFLNNSKRKVYISALAKKVDCTYSHIVKLLQKMEKMGLVNLSKNGRTKTITLTKKGKEIAELMEKVIFLF